MALQHLRSSTLDKRPTPGAMSDGQLALNTNLTSPGLFFKDSNGDSVKIGPVHVGTTAPNATPGAGGQAGNSKGEAWLDTTATNPILKVWNGSAFVAVQPVGTGTVVSTTDTGTVTSTMILDGTIVNADINASAAIDGTKVSPNFGSQDVVTTGNVTVNGQGDVRFGDSDSSNYVGFQAPAAIAADLTWTLPATDGTVGQVLKTDGTGALGWVSPSVSGPILENQQIIGASYTLSTGYNGVSAGPVEVGATYTVTVPAGAVWVIV